MMMMNIKYKVIGDLLVTGTAFKLISWENTNKSTSRGEKVFAIAIGSVPSDNLYECCFS